MAYNVEFTNELWTIKNGNQYNGLNALNVVVNWRDLQRRKMIFFYNGDIVRCTNCEWVGEIIVDNEAWVKEALNKTGEI